MFRRHALKLCKQCPHTVRRTLTTETTISTVQSPETSESKSSNLLPHISTAIILSRSPILTRTPTLFEQAYYSYETRIRRALQNPFPFDFYFKQGSLLETRFNMEEKRRERNAFGPGFAEEESVSEEKAAADKAAVEQLAQQEGEGEEIAPREHASDISGDLKSLDRKGICNLYLLLHVQENGKDVWRFPQGGVEKTDFLHQAALKDLHSECGDKMDTWVVSRNPIGVYKKSESENVVFFYKAHIMAGQVTPESKHIKDFAWLTKEEIEPLVEKDYWIGIKDMLSSE